MSNGINRFEGTAFEIPEILSEEPPLLASAKEVEMLANRSGAFEVAAAQMWLPIPVRCLEESLQTQSSFIDLARGMTNSSPDKRGPHGRAFGDGVVIGRVIGQPLFTAPLPGLNGCIQEAVHAALTLSKDLAENIPNNHLPIDESSVRPGRQLARFGLAGLGNFTELKIPMLNIAKRRGVYKEEQVAFFAGVGCILFFLQRARSQAVADMERVRVDILRRFMTESWQAGRDAVEAQLLDTTAYN